MVNRLVAEAIGTFWIVFAGCGAAVLGAAFPQLGIGVYGVSMAFGLISIKGTGFGSFLKTAEHAYLGLNQGAYKRREDWWLAWALPGCTDVKSAVPSHVIC